MLNREEQVEEVRRVLRRLTSEIDALDARAARRFGVNRSDLACLDALGARGPLTPSDLARAARLSSGGLSIALERLERAGLVRRRPNPADRRSVIVDMTQQARRTARRVFGPLAGRERELLGRYDEQSLEVIRSFIAGWTEILTDHLAESASGTDAAG